MRENDYIPMWLHLPQIHNTEANRSLLQDEKEMWDRNVIKQKKQIVTWTDLDQNA